MLSAIWERTFQKCIAAYGTSLILPQAVLRYPLELLDELIADSIDFRRWMLGALHQALDQRGE